MQYTRNSDLSYYKENRMAANCGSYALRLNEWYDPEEYFENVTGTSVDSWIVEMAEEYDDDEITYLYIELLVEGMLKEFEDELEICDGQPPTTDDVELIAFNAFCYYSEGDFFADYDFHFRVLRDGVWKEKCGTDEVKECDIKNWGRYTGKTVYFYHKLKEGIA